MRYKRGRWVGGNDPPPAGYLVSIFQNPICLRVLNFSSTALVKIGDLLPKYKGSVFQKISYSSILHFPKLYLLSNKTVLSTISCCTLKMF